MERTQTGMDAARAPGRVGGMPKGLTKKSKELAGVAATLYRQKIYNQSDL